MITTAWSAHPVVRVLVLAPNPLSGPSPGRLAGSVFALDSSAKAGPSLGLLVVVGDDHCCTRSIGPRCTHRALFSTRGGLLVGRIIILRRGSPICRCKHLATFTFKVLMYFKYRRKQVMMKDSWLYLLLLISENKCTSPSSISPSRRES